LKHYAAITTPEMLWRYGLGPRPVGLEDWIATVNDLERTRHFRVVIDLNPHPDATSKTSGKEVSAQPASTEEGVEATEALRRRPSHVGSGRSASSSSGSAALEVAPLRQVPFIPPSLGKFLITF